MSGVTALRHFSPSQVTHGHRHRVALLGGMAKMARAVGASLGPSGGDALAEAGREAPRLLHDGAAIAVELVLDDPVEELGAAALREVARGVDAEVGDGSARAVVIAHQIYRRAVRAITAGAEPLAVAEGIQIGTHHAVGLIQASARTASRRDRLAAATSAAGGQAFLAARALRAVELTAGGGEIKVVPVSGAGAVERLKLGHVVVGPKGNDRTHRALPIVELSVRAATQSAARRRAIDAGKAIASGRATRRGGVVPGGGVALLRVADHLSRVEMPPEVLPGVEAVRRALEQPMRQLAANAGHVPEAVLAECRRSRQAPCFQGSTVSWVDPDHAGLLEPVDLLTAVLRQAGSIAKLLTSTEVAITRRGGWSGGPQRRRVRTEESR